MMSAVLEYLEFTQLSNTNGGIVTPGTSFRVPGIYTALKREKREYKYRHSFRVPGIYTALKRVRYTPVLFSRFRVPGIYTALKQV